MPSRPALGACRKLSRDHALFSHSRQPLRTSTLNLGYSGYFVKAVDLV
jgi:hypothetical protein